LSFDNSFSCEETVSDLRIYGSCFTHIHYRPPHKPLLVLVLWPASPERGIFKFWCWMAPVCPLVDQQSSMGKWLNLSEQRWVNLSERHSIGKNKNTSKHINR
jgi:hypothetical protein